ncbi:MAG: hypothetical protein Q8P41_25025 [Pseudomonadota bacterium]|nr:hypothetical protein [Pseudomonadota bacterium]
MLRALSPWLLAVALAAGGVLVGWGADRHLATALVLHAEPFLLVLAAWAAAVAVWAGRRSYARALVIGAVAASLGARLPIDVAPAAGVPPAWVGPVNRCAAALKPPADPVRLLQWTLGGGESPEFVRGVVADAAPGVVVLHGVSDPEVVRAVLAEVGGESRFFPPEGGGIGLAIVAAGGFHPCGETLAWSEAMDTAYGYTFAFVGVPPATVFPLLVARLPGPLDGGAWSERMTAASSRVFSALAGIQGASTVVVADAPAPRTYRTLDTRMAGVGAASVAVPPSWPARLGKVPLLTLHPFDRMWIGPIWREAESSRAASPAGLRAPVITVLSGPEAPSVDVTPME